MHVRLKHSIRIAFMLLMVGATLPLWAEGPFGFEYGMSKEQVVHLIGKHAIKPYNPKMPNLYMALKAPNPHPAFGGYLLVITPEKGLIKIKAYSYDIKTDGYGEAVKSRFHDIQEALEKKYGEGKNFDRLKDGSKLTDPKDWMETLDKKERGLATFWEFEKPRDHIEAILLEATTLDLNRGLVVLSYELEGFSSYADSHKINEGTVF